MKTNESTTVKTIAILNKALTTLTRINGNTDTEVFRKECILFRNSLGLTPCKLGGYTMPKGYQDFIDSQTVGAASDIRSRRQATTASIVACYALDKKGSRAAAYLKEALKGKIALEAITPLEWAVLKTKVNAHTKKAKEARDSEKKTSDISADTSDISADTSDISADTSDISADTSDISADTSDISTAPRIGVGVQTKINTNASFNKDTENRAKIALETLEKYSDTSVIVCLARMALAKYETM